MKRITTISASVALSLSLLISGCEPLRTLLHRPLEKVDLQVQVKPNSTSGTYDLTGLADLPDSSPIRIAAIRYLRPTNPASQKLNPKPTYAILDYQSALVKGGKWQGQLNLWQVAADGRYQEAWQIHQDALKLPTSPESDVIFLVTLAPVNGADPLRVVEQALKEQGREFDTRLISGTSDGQRMDAVRYVRVAQSLPIGLPTGQTTPPAPRPEDIHGGWGNRFIIPPEPPNPYVLEFPQERRTNARPSPREFLQ
jgi:hypothetical protein